MLYDEAGRPIFKPAPVPVKETTTVPKTTTTKKTSKVSKVIENLKQSKKEGKSSEEALRSARDIIISQPTSSEKKSSSSSKVVKTVSSEQKAKIDAQLSWADTQSGGAPSIPTGGLSPIAQIVDDAKKGITPIERTFIESSPMGPVKQTTVPVSPKLPIASFTDMISSSPTQEVMEKAKEAPIILTKKDQIQWAEQELIREREEQRTSDFNKQQRKIEALSNLYERTSGTTQNILSRGLQQAFISGDAIGNPTTGNLDLDKQIREDAYGTYGASQIGVSKSDWNKMQENFKAIESSKEGSQWTLGDKTYTREEALKLFSINVLNKEYSPSTSYDQFKSSVGDQWQGTIFDAYERPPNISPRQWEELREEYTAGEYSSDELNKKVISLQKPSFYRNTVGSDFVSDADYSRIMQQVSRGFISQDQANEQLGSVLRENLSGSKDWKTWAEKNVTFGEEGEKISWSQMKNQEPALELTIDKEGNIGTEMDYLSAQRKDMQEIGERAGVGGQIVKGVLDIGTQFPHVFSAGAEAVWHNITTPLTKETYQPPSIAETIFPPLRLFSGTGERLQDKIFQGSYGISQAARHGHETGDWGSYASKTVGLESPLTTDILLPAATGGAFAYLSRPGGFLLSTGAKMAAHGGVPAFLAKAAPYALVTGPSAFLGGQIGLMAAQEQKGELPSGATAGHIGRLGLQFTSMAAGAQTMGDWLQKPHPRIQSVKTKTSSAYSKAKGKVYEKIPKVESLSKDISFFRMMRDPYSKAIDTSGWFPTRRSRFGSYLGKRLYKVGLERNLLSPQRVKGVGHLTSRGPRTSREGILSYEQLSGRGPRYDPNIRYYESLRTPSRHDIFSARRPGEVGSWKYGVRRSPSINRGIISDPHEYYGITDWYDPKTFITEVIHKGGLGRAAVRGEVVQGEKGSTVAYRGEEQLGEAYGLKVRGVGRKPVRGIGRSYDIDTVQSIDPHTGQLVKKSFDVGMHQVGEFNPIKGTIYEEGMFGRNVGMSLRNVGKGGSPTYSRSGGFGHSVGSKKIGMHDVYTEHSILPETTEGSHMFKRIVSSGGDKAKLLFDDPSISQVQSSLKNVLSKHIVSREGGGSGGLIAKTRGLQGVDIPQNWRGVYDVPYRYSDLIYDKPMSFFRPGKPSLSKLMNPFEVGGMKRTIPVMGGASGFYSAFSLHVPSLPIASSLLSLTLPTQGLSSSSKSIFKNISQTGLGQHSAVTQHSTLAQKPGLETVTSSKVDTTQLVTPASAVAYITQQTPISQTQQVQVTTPVVSPVSTPAVVPMPVVDTFDFRQDIIHTPDPIIDYTITPDPIIPEEKRSPRQHYRRGVKRPIQHGYKEKSYDVKDMWAVTKFKKPKYFSLAKKR